MLRLCIVEYLRNAKRNLIISILLATTIVMVLLTTGNIKTTYRYYAGIAPYLGEQGVLMPEAIYTNKQSLSAYLDGLKGVKNFKLFGSTYMGFDFDGDESYRKVYLYDEEDEKNVMPELMEGAWSESNPNDKTIMHVLVSENEDDIQVGDILSSNYVTKEGALADVNVKVVGKIPDGERIAGNLQYGSNVDAISYESFYSPFDLEQNEECIFISTEKEFSKFEDAELHISGIGILRYEDDLTKEERKELENQVRTYFLEKGALTDIGAHPLRFTYENSNCVIRTLVAKFLPFAIAGLVISFICILASSAVSTLEGMYHYTVYYLTGMKWNGILNVSGFAAVVNNMVSVMIAAIAILVMKLKVPNIADRIMVDYGELGIIAGLLLLAVVFAMIMPLVIMKGNQPSKLLRDMKV